jgi:hypothetical protein
VSNGLIRAAMRKGHVSEFADVERVIFDGSHPTFPTCSPDHQHHQRPARRRPVPEALLVGRGGPIRLSEPEVRRPEEAQSELRIVLYSRFGCAMLRQRAGTSYVGT